MRTAAHTSSHFLLADWRREGRVIQSRLLLQHPDSAEGALPPDRPQGEAFRLHLLPLTFDLSTLLSVTQFRHDSCFTGFRGSC